MISNVKFGTFLRVIPGEGFELMLRCLREKKHAAWCAVKVLDFALTDDSSNCERCATRETRGYCLSSCPFLYYVK